MNNFFSVSRHSPHGFLILDKPAGISSQKAVSILKSILGVNKAGHTGTLDPLATGVLPIALGEATKVIDYLDESCKEYQVRARLGAWTDTYDSDGVIQEQADPSGISREAIQEATAFFLGSYDQVPPPYSAIKFKGKPLYRYARQGEDVVLKARPIQVSRIDLLDVVHPEFELKVQCSRGTYIRSLIHELGRHLGCFAFVIHIRRLMTGPFALSRSIKMEDLQKSPEEARIHLISIEDALGSAIPRLKLESQEECGRICSGVPVFRVADLLREKGLLDQNIALSFQGKVVAFVNAPCVGEGFVIKRVLKVGVLST